jgi:lysophospholipase L1-like esterase
LIFRVACRGRAWAALFLVLLPAAPAHAWIGLAGDTSQPGQITLLVWGSGAFTKVDITERIGGADTPLMTVVPDTVTNEVGEQLSGSVYVKATQWRCDRLERRLTATGRRADGTTEIASYTVRTPSCRNRLRLIVGKRGRITIRDTFELGGVDARLCARHCRTVRIRSGRTAIRTRVGTRRITVTTPYQRLRPRTHLPHILTTGDSLIETVDSVLGDRLTGRALVDSDPHIGSGLTKSFPADWTKVPGREVRRFHPKATVMFIGTNDAWPIDGVECCGERWIELYAQRARRTMRTYLSSGPVVWLNIPYSKYENRTAQVTAVNTALARAVQGLDRATVVDVAGLLTPGGRFEAFRDGRRIRQPDGVHVAPAGAAIVAREIMRRLERFRVL